MTKRNLVGITFTVVILVASCLLLQSTAQAVTVIMDFDSATPAGPGSLDYFEDGFRMQSTGGHYHFSGGGGTGGSTYVRLDTQALSWSTVRFDYFGNSFDLLSLDVVYLYAMDPVGPIATIASSAGGIIHLNDMVNDLGVLNFSGRDWKSLTWVEFSIGTNTQFYAGIDTIHFGVPEPSTILLLGSGLIGLLGFRRKFKK